jgi:hypothetical protein
MTIPRQMFINVDVFNPPILFAEANRNPFAIDSCESFSLVYDDIPGIAVT